MSQSTPSDSEGGGGRAAAAVQLVLRAAVGLHFVGEPVPIEVELRNVSDTDVWIVGVLDGSEAGIRFPHYGSSVLYNGQAVAEPWAEDPLVGPLLRSHFRRLSPREGFDPTTGEGGAGLPLTVFTQFRPAAEGRYQYRLTFSTESTRPEQWFGRFGQRDDERDVLLDLISRVPRGVLTATTDVTVRA
ncbi:hypothetical protein [Streptomyces sp. NPDC127066]|uniref:hypothetical protein n=1 Tax=Streptomyces sp. NPDC127066 TaxID=3347125 RepID=UPI0036541187